MKDLIEAYKKNFDVTLIKENLKLSVEERFRQMMNLQKFYAELQRAGKKLKND